MSALPPIDDAMRARLRAMVNATEDQWMERKPLPNDGGRDIRRTLVAFANSVNEREFAVLFIGAADDLNHPGVRDCDELQKRVEEIATTQCYPAIEYKAVPLELGVNGETRTVLAVLVPPSERRPHFSGPAYVRRGSQTREASKEMMDELVAGRIEKARVLQRIKGQIDLVERSARGLEYRFKGSIRQVTPHFVEVMNEMNHWWGVPLEKVEILSVASPWTTIVIPARTPEAAHIRRMLEAWSFAHLAEATPMRLATEDFTMSQLLPIASEVMPILWDLRWHEAGHATPQMSVFQTFLRRTSPPSVGNRRWP